MSEAGLSLETRIRRTGLRREIEDVRLEMREATEETLEIRVWTRAGEGISAIVLCCCML